MLVQKSKIDVPDFGNLEHSNIVACSWRVIKSTLADKKLALVDMSEAYLLYRKLQLELLHR